MKQRSIREYTNTPLQDYNIVTTEWLGKSSSPVSTNIKTRSYKLKSQKIVKSPPRKCFSQTSPLGKWIQHTSYNQLNSEDKHGKNTSKIITNSNIRSVTHKKCDVVYPDVNKLLKNIDLLKEEGKLLDNYDDICKENDISLPLSLKLTLNSSEKDNQPSKKVQTRSYNSKSKYKNKGKQSLSQKPVTEVLSPLGKWLQCKRLQNKDKSVSEHNTTPFNKNDSFERYGVVLPTVDDILKNKDAIKEEIKILDDYDIFEEGDISIPSSLKALLDSPEMITIPLLTCESLSESQLKIYFSKYLDSLKNISEGVEFSQRHQTYNDYNSRSKLTYSFSTAVFAESQLEYLINNIEKALDPEEKRTEYLFMVILPELCLKIFMDVFDMSKEEAINYLNQRPVD